jgi:HD-like signal output (HDOD) protein
MDRERKLALIERSLGLRHKIKVHESMKPPETHEELSALLLAKWELEDELRAIEEIIQGDRDRGVAERRKDLISATGPVKKKTKK